MKSRIISLTTFFLISSSISGCAISVERLVRDDNLRHRVLKDCVALGSKAVESRNCKNAAEAQTRVAGKALKKIFD